MTPWTLQRESRKRTRSGLTRVVQEGWQAMHQPRPRTDLKVGSRRSSNSSSRLCGTMGRNTPRKAQNVRWYHLDAKEESIPESRREVAGPE